MTDTPVASPANTLIARIREAGVHTVVYGLGSTMQALVALLLTPALTRSLSPAEYGTYSLATLAGTVAGAVFSLGASSSLARSYYDSDSPSHRRAVIATSLIITLVGSILLLCLAIVGSASISVWLLGSHTYERYVMVALVTAAFASVSTLLLVLLRFERRSLAVVVVNIVGAIVSGAVTLYGLWIAHLGIVAPLLGTLIAQILGVAALGWLTRDALSFRATRNELALQLRFGLPAVLIGVNYYVLDTIDRFFIRAYWSLSDVGVYSLAYRIGMLIQVVFILPFSQIWAPMRMEYGRESGSARLFTTALTYYVLIGLLIATGVTVASHDFLPRFAGRAAYASADRVVPFVLLGHLAYGAINILDYGIIVARRVYYHVYVFAAGVVLNVGLNWWLVPRIGFMGAAYSTFISYVFVLTVLRWRAHRIHPIAVEGARVVRLLASSVLVIGTALALPRAAPLWATIKLLLAMAVLGAYWWFGVLSQRERQVGSAILRRCGHVPLTSTS